TIPLPFLAPYIARSLDRGGRAALVFGPEKRGLTRDDLALCHLLVEIPTHPGQPSMNLGQAVAVCLYELAARSHSQGKSTALPPDPASAPAAMRDLDLVAQVVADTMRAAHYSPAAMQKANRRDLDLLLRRLALTHADARRILGLFRRILWRLNRI
ncbi:MAG: TrmH family RNA methyltransferase, partial [Terracidiphilus sp.]